MANSSLSLTSIDFDTLKRNFKTYLSNQSAFKDYDYDGSNMNVLLDVMSYNSYLNSFYLNMVAAEMFLDSAQKYDSVVSHAKELNYIPRSVKSSEAIVSFDVDLPGLSGILTVPKGLIFAGLNSNGAFNFVTDSSTNYTSGNNTFNVTNLKIYEGTYITDTFIIDKSIEGQQFVLSNQNIDTDSITVNIIEGAETTSYLRADTIYGLDSDSKVYFLQAAQNGLYEIVFGDGFIGKYPNNFSTISVNYRVSSGPASDGITAFGLSQDLGFLNGITTSASISNLTVVSSSGSGALQESIDSIKFLAPRYYATQQRAVATDDYSALVLSKFGGQVADVSVFGGETLSPKQYGRVVVSIKPSFGTIAPDYLKSEISNYLLEYVSLPTRVLITDPEYFYCKIDTTVQYKNNSTALTADQIQGKILNTVKSYSANNLEKFGNDFRYSKFVSNIDSADSSIVSNDTNAEIIKRIAPSLNQKTTFNIEFGNAAEMEEYFAGYSPGNKFYDEPVLTSTPFTYVSSNGTNYTNSYIRDDNKGGLVVYTFVNGVFTILENIGTIDYSTGQVKINNILVSYYGEYISIYFRTAIKDIIMGNGKILIIDPQDVSISLENVLN